MQTLGMLAGGFFIDTTSLCTVDTTHDVSFDVLYLPACCLAGLTPQAVDCLHAQGMHATLSFAFRVSIKMPKAHFNA